MDLAQHLLVHQDLLAHLFHTDLAARQILHQILALHHQMKI
jgi:hypothetical protein